MPRKRYASRRSCQHRWEGLLRPGSIGRLEQYKGNSFTVNEPMKKGSTTGVGVNELCPGWKKKEHLMNGLGISFFKLEDLSACDKGNHNK